MKKMRKNLVALEIRVFRDIGVHRVSIFSQGRREEGFDFYRQLLRSIEAISRVARHSRPVRTMPS
jgi:hypothetical protein